MVVAAKRPLRSAHLEDRPRRFVVVTPVEVVSAIPPGDSTVYGEPASRHAVRKSPTTRRQFLGTVAASLGTSFVLTKSASAMVRPSRQALPAGLPTGLVYDSICKCHVPGVNRPECPQRYDAVLGALSKSNYFSGAEGL